MLTGYQRLQIAALVHRSPRTVERVYLGRGNAFSREAVARGAAKLGLPPPPSPASTSPRSSSSSPLPSPIA